MLKILLLGPPVIEFDEKPLKIQRKLIRSLLVFLACHPNGVGREDIITRYWLDKTVPEGRKALRESLSKLRTQLPNSEYIQTNLDRVWLNRHLVYSDVFEYNDLVQTTFQFLTSSRNSETIPDTIIAKLEQAVGLWRSPNFFAGEVPGNNPDFDIWRQETTSAWELDLVQNLERLANHFAKLGEYERAIHFAQTALRTDAHNEELQEQLLDWLYKAGRVSEAQTYYTYLSQLYKREFDEDLPEILQVRMDKAEQVVNSALLPNPIHWNLSVVQQQHFVGRINELQILRRRYAVGDVVIIRGEAGSGKTRLVHQFFITLDKKPRLLLGTCTSHVTDLPLQPIIDMIRTSIKDEDWMDLDPKWVRALSVIAPDVFRYPGGNLAASDSTPVQSRAILFEAIRQLLLAISRSSRVLVVLDDAHWSDIGSLEIFMYLIERGFFTASGLCVIISRTDIQNPQIHEMLFNKPHRTPITRIELGLLNSSEVREMTRYLMGQTPIEDFLERLMEATGGNPLFIIETINALLASTGDKSSVQDEKKLPVASSIANIVGEMLEMISPQSKQVLYSAAMCGVEFQIEVLELMEDMDSFTLVQCLEELEENHWVKPIANSNPGKYTFVHNLIRDAVASRISHARQCLLHNQIASAMSASQSHLSKGQSSVIARHFEEAGRPLPAFRNWVLAGIHARSLYATSEAYTAFHRADSIRSRLEAALSESDIYQLYSEWGSLAYTIADVSSMVECYTAMVSAGEQKNSALLKGAGFSGLGLAAVLQFDIGKSLVLLEQSRLILENTDHTFEKILVNSRLGISLVLCLRILEAEEVYLKAIEIGRDFETSVIRKAVAEVQYQLAFLYCLMGYSDRALEFGNQSLDNAYLQVSNLESQEKAHLVLSLANYYAGQNEETLSQVEKCLKFSESIQNYRTSSLAYLIKARSNLELGRLGEAWDLAQLALRIATENNYPEIFSESHCIMGDFFCMLENFPQAIEEYTIGCHGMMETFHGMNNTYRLGYVIGRYGDQEKGLAILDDVIGLAQSVDMGAIYLLALIYRGIILRDNNRNDEASEIISRASNEANLRGLGFIHRQLRNLEGDYSIDPGNVADIERTIHCLSQQPFLPNNSWIMDLFIKIRDGKADRSESEQIRILYLITDLEKLFR